MKTLMKTLPVVAALFLSGTKETRSAVLHYSFRGQVEQATRESLLSSGLTVGAPVSGEFSFSLTSNEEQVGDSISGYRQIAPATLQVSLADVEVANEGEFIATVLNAAISPGVRDYSLAFSDGAVQTLVPPGFGPSLTGDSILVDGVAQTGSIAISFTDAFSAMRDESTALPTELEISDFSFTDGRVQVVLEDPRGGQDLVTVRFSIRSIQRVPEPRWLAYYAICFASLAVPRKRG